MAAWRSPSAIRMTRIGIWRFAVRWWSTESGADDHIDRLAQKYLGEERYSHRKPGVVRVMYKIEPQSFSSMG